MATLDLFKKSPKDLSHRVHEDINVGVVDEHREGGQDFLGVRWWPEIMVKWWLEIR